MKRVKSENLQYPNPNSFLSLTKQRPFQILISVALLYLLLVTVEIPFIFRTGFSELSRESSSLPRPIRLNSEPNLDEIASPTRPLELISRNSTRSGPTQSPTRRLHRVLSTLPFDRTTFDSVKSYGSSDLYRAAKLAWEIGKVHWSQLESGSPASEPKRPYYHNRTESCPSSVSFTGSEFAARKGVMVIPCGLTLGSHVTVVGKPRAAREESDPKISMVKEGEEGVLVSEFKMELQGLKTVDGEEPPRVLHFNPRLRGDWSGGPVMELNTCYRQQWGTALRCEGWKSKADEETVDGQVKCEKWIRGNDNSLEETKATWWLGRLIGRTKKVTVDWPFPFAEEKLFVLTVSAGLEGYHINVDGRHVTSFPYRAGFTLEDATGLAVSGDIDVHSVYAASLPSSHPSFAPQRHLELLKKWAAPPVPEGEIELFIGILSAGNHFSERMAVRKSWMQHKLIRSSKVVARFFVALHARKEVNVELMREAEFFGDIVIVPYMDNYDLVVLKTVAICEHGVRAVSAKYVMKCDDDTFVRVDAVLNEAKKIPQNKSFYIGNINYHHKPLRSGKWAVTYEEWLEEDYPPYANGPGYIMSSDIANFIVTEFGTHNLRLFKMEDVSMGLWVEKFNSTTPVEYVHSLRFCQFGCIEDYLTAHYQSPRQMMCMWDKLQRVGKPQCCNMRRR